MGESGNRAGAARRISPLLALIFAFYLLDRVAASGFLLPYYCVEDERWLREGALRMVTGLTLDPGTHKYPGLAFNLTAGLYAAWYAAHNALALLHFDSFNSFRWHLAHYHFDFPATIMAGRIMTAVFAALALALFFRLARRTHGETRAGAAAFLCATAPAFLFGGGLLKNDALVAAGVMLAVLAALRLFERGRRLDYLVAGAAFGFCLAAKYHLAAGIPLLVAHRLRNSDTGVLRAFARPRWLVSAAAALAAFFLLSPMTFLDLGNALRQAGTELALQNSLNPLFHASASNWWNAPGLFLFTVAFPMALGLPLAALALAGFLRTRPWHAEPIPPERLILWSYPVAFILMMGALSRLAVPHLFMPAVPFLGLLAAGALEPGLAAAGRGRRLAALGVLAAVVLGNLFTFHSLAALEERVLIEGTEFVEATAVPGEDNAAFVPYFPNPERAWPMRFYPQFALSPKVSRELRPDRIFLHHTFFNAYRDDPELLGVPPVASMYLYYLELRAGRAGYRETDRFAGSFPGFPLYTRIVPDLAGLWTSVYARQPAPPDPLIRRPGGVSR